MAQANAGMEEEMRRLSRPVKLSPPRPVQQTMRLEEQPSQRILTRPSYRPAHLEPPEDEPICETPSPQGHVNRLTEFFWSWT